MRSALFHLDRLAFWLGPGLFALLPFLPLPMAMTAKLALGATLWIAVWWVAEAVPVAATALLPLVLFPVCGILPMKTTAAEYSNEIIYLFLAGFILGKTVEKWGLHRRIALGMVARIGTEPRLILLGFMLATAFISMWISNTATAIMMLPVALAVAGSSDAQLIDTEDFSVRKGASNFSKSLLLGIGYACSIGGMATVIGTPTNAIFISFAKQKFPAEEVSFGKWLAFGLPYAAILLGLCWLILLRLFPLEKESAAGSREAVFSELKKLGRLTVAEKRTLAVFALVVAGWVSGSFFWYRFFPKEMGIGDSVVALVGAILVFLVPKKGLEGEKLMDWPTAAKIPWEILLLFGGGLALAKGFEASGLARFLGDQLTGLGSWPLFFVLFGVLALTVLLSEVASNIATASMMMPVLAALAGAIGAHPFGLLMAATLAASVGFMLPIATAPNSIVFSSGHLKTRDMIRAGFWLDLVAIFLLIGFVFWVMPLVWGISVK